jgi:AP-3 complex subunit sigma
VCELDIIFNTEKVHAVLDEIVMGGMVVETNIQEITAAIDGQARAEKAELGAMPQMFAPNRAMTTTARQR